MRFLCLSMLWLLLTAVRCEKPLTLDEIAGDWVVENWNTSRTDPTEVSTVRVRIDPGQRAALFFDVPDNDWGYTEGDVAFFDLVEIEAPYEVNATTQLRYLPQANTPGGMSVVIGQLNHEQLEVYQTCPTCNFERIMSLRR